MTGEPRRVAAGVRGILYVAGRGIQQLRPARPAGQFGRAVSLALALVLTWAILPWSVEAPPALAAAGLAPSEPRCMTRRRFREHAAGSTARSAASVLDATEPDTASA